MDFFIILHGFGATDCQHCPKEFSVVSIDDKTVAQAAAVKALFKEYKALNSWSTGKDRGKRYPRTFTYEKARTHIREILCKARTIYVNGAENQQWLMDFLGLLVPIVNLTDLDYRLTVELKLLSGYSSWEYRCVDKNAEPMKIWLIVANVF